jgi:hypothetical protein
MQLVGNCEPQKVPEYELVLRERSKYLVLCREGQLKRVASTAIALESIMLLESCLSLLGITSLKPSHYRGLRALQKKLSQKS